MREVSVTVYNVDELDDKAKEKAYYKWLDNSCYFWGDDNENTLQEFAKVFKLNIKSWEYDYAWSHVSFDFDYCLYDNIDEVEELSGVRLATYIYNNFYDQLIKGKYYSTGGYYDENGKYHYKSRHSKVMFEENGCPLTGYYMDNEILEPIFEFLKKPNKYTTFRELMYDCFQSWGKACVNDYNHCTSQEYFEEDAKNNDWEFYSDGRIA